MSEAFIVETECGGANDFDGRIGLRVSSIFVIGFGSLLGALLPVFAARTKAMKVPKLAFFIAKYFGSGVIIATAFIHLLAPATEALQNPCLSGPITEYSWAEGIALMTVFSMFFIELMASRFDIFGSHDHNDLEGANPAKELLKDSAEKPAEHESPVLMRALPMTKHVQENQQHSLTNASSSNEIDSIIYSDVEPTVHHATTHPTTRDGDFSYPPGGEDHLSHQRSHTDEGNFAVQMTAIFILEFGVIFHSIFIGLTLAVAGDEFDILYIVLVFHQTFEGLGLGSRLATAQWPKRKAWLPWVLGAAYGVTTPIAIAVGLGVRETFSPGDPNTIIVNGVFDAISAGILIYTGLVELMAHEFMFNQEMRKSSIWMVLSAFGCMCLGAGLMALLGKWA